MTPTDVTARSPSELKQRIEAERSGDPCLIYRDGDGSQVIRRLSEPTKVTLGRGADVDVDLGFDPTVSRAHAELVPVGSDWALVDDGLSRNGSFVNRERVVARRRLRDGDLLQVGEAVLLFRDPRLGHLAETAGEKAAAAATQVTERQRRVLIALCRPFSEGSEFTGPATNRQIADEVFLSVDAVKGHLRALFERFELGDLPQNEKRIRMAELAMRSGIVTLRDLGVLRD